MKKKKRLKFILSLIVAILWVLFSIWIAKDWIFEVANTVNFVFMVFALCGIAFIPGFIIVFMYVSLFQDKRVSYDLEEVVNTTVLIAAWNEEKNILKPLESIENQRFRGLLEIIVIDDGSRDETSKIARKFMESERKHEYKLITLEKNQGKSGALNEGLKIAKYGTIATMDADTTLGTNDSLQRLVSSLNGEYKSVAGAVISRNAKKNWITRLQEWDYLFGISLVKRIQSMYSGTLVCQGAFSAYRKEVLLELGGWKHVVGEDIVLTWDMLNKGYKTYHNPEAIAETETPETYKQFFHQRKRWSRGMIEAFRSNWKLLFRFNLRTIFVWYNLLFPYIDFVFALIFVPAIIGAIFFKFYLLASSTTLWIIPLSLFFISFLYKVQKKTFKKLGLNMSKNYGGIFLYVLFFQIIQTPATLSGYFSEIFKLKKNWGTKSNKIIKIVLILLISSTSLFGQKNKTGSGTNLLFDSDKNFTSKSWVEYSRTIDDSFSLSLKSGDFYLKDKFAHENYGFTSLKANKKWSKHFSSDICLEQMYGGWDVTLYDVKFKIDSISKFHIELFSSRTILDAVPALDDKVTIFSNGVTVDYNILKNLVIVGGVIHQSFSDNNNRNIYLGKISWVIKDYLVIYSKSKIARIKDWNPNYFSPEMFDTYTIGTYKYLPLFKDKFLIKPDLGGGLQIIYEEKKPYYYFGALIKGNINENISLNMNMFYSNAQSQWGNYGLFMGNIGLYYKF
jgi:biofilm PGA synthesis N-glycosyltransferase PgaC